jgi:uncharacterized protein (TIGR03067 family)
LPFTGELMSVLSQVLLDEPPPPSKFRPDLEPELEAICLKAMAKRVEERYSSMAVFAGTLAGFLRGKAVSGPQPTPAPVPVLSTKKTDPEGIRVSQMGGLRSVANLQADLPRAKELENRAKQSSATVVGKTGKKRRRKRRRLWSLSKERPWVFYTTVATLAAVPVLLALWLSRRGGQPDTPGTLTHFSGSGTPGTATQGDGGTIEPATPPDDLKTLQGEWDVWAEEARGMPTKDEVIRQMSKTITFAEQRMTIYRTMDGKRMKIEGTIRLDPRRKPKTWDFSGIHYFGKQAEYRGLYEVNGDSLRLTYSTGPSGEGEPVRPAEFRTSPQTSTVIIHAKRRNAWAPLFNGKDLTGWKTHPSQPGNWRVENGVLTGSRGPGSPHSHLYTERDDYQDFHLSIEARPNTGVYFRAPLGPSPTWVKGYNAKLDKTRAGGLLFENEPRLKRLREIQLDPSEWVLFEVIASGDQLAVKINGQTTAEFADEKRRYTRGHIVLQQHGAATVAEFRKIEIKELGAAPHPPSAPPPSQAIFNGHDLSGWEKVGGGTWTVADGILRAQGSGNGPGWLASERDYDNFELDLEYRLSPKGNSGVFVHAWKDAPLNGGKFLEIQLIDDEGYNTLGKVNGTAAIFGVLTPARAVRSIPGVWHKLGIVSSGRRLRVSFEGQPVLDANLDNHAALFTRFPGLQRTSGRIGLQQHGSAVEFRNIKLRILP